ncbi:MAG: antitoxin [Janthinobacterium lividum]
MQQTAKLFRNGQREMLDLPDEFRFGCDEVDIRRDPESGDIILSGRKQNLDEFFRLQDSLTQQERDELMIPGRDRTPESSEEPKSLANFFQLLDRLGAAEPEFLAERDHTPPTDRNLF